MFFLFLGKENPKNIDIANNRNMMYPIIKLELFNIPGNLSFKNKKIILKLINKINIIADDKIKIFFFILFHSPP